MKQILYLLFRINTPGINIKRIEIWTWIIVATIFTTVLSLGENNGVGIYQQPDQSLAPPLILGSVINGYIIYLLGIGIIPNYYLKRQFLKLLYAIIVLFVLSIAVKTISDLLLIYLLYTDLRDQSLVDLMEDNVYFSLSIFVLGIFFGVYKSLTYKSRLSPDEIMAIPSGKKLFRFKKGEIDYFEAQGNYIKVVGRFKSEMLYTTLSKLEKQIDPLYFLRIHRSYIVSIRNASYIGTKKVLIDNKEIPVGTKYQMKIKTFLSDKVTKS